MCGGGGSSGTQKFEYNDTIKPYWEGVLPEARQLSDRPYQQYQGQRIAGLNQDQQNALAAGRRVFEAGGPQVTQDANTQASDTLNDTYLTGAMRDPYAGASNPYSGFGTQFYDVVNRNLGDMANAYQQGTSAETTRLMNMNGVLGGSAHQNAVANNQAALAKQMGNYVAGMTNDQFNRSAGLEDARLGRGMTAYEGERGRQMGAMGQGNAGMQDFLSGLQSYMGIGDVQRSHQQDLLNQGFNDWQTQQQYPYTQLDYLTGILSRAQGGVSPNVTQSMSGYAASPYSQILGAGLLGYGMTR